MLLCFVYLLCAVCVWCVRVCWLFTRTPAQLWKFSGPDLCEIARHSVLQSGFEHPFKVHFLGDNYAVPGPDGNNMLLTNVPDIRLQFRHEALQAELDTVLNASPA